MNLYLTHFFDFDQSPELTNMMGYAFIIRNDIGFVVYNEHIHQINLNVVFSFNFHFSTFIFGIGVY